MNRYTDLFKAVLQSKSFDKVLAFLLSLGLWFYVVSGKSVIDTEKFELKYNINNNLSFIKAPAQYITLRYQGPRAYWGQLKNEPSLSLDLSSFKKLRNRTQKYKIKSHDLPYLNGLKLIEFSPKEIEFSLGRKVFKKIPVSLKNFGGLDESLSIEEVSINPSEIKLSGASNIIKTIDDLSTEWVDLSDVTEGMFQKKVRLNVPDQTNANVKSVILSIRLKGKSSDKKSVEVPVSFLSHGRPVKSYPNKIKVTFSPNSAFARDGGEKISAIVEIPEDFNGQKINRPVKISINDDFKLIDFSPREVTIEKDKDE